MEIDVLKNVLPRTGPIRIITTGSRIWSKPWLLYETLFAITRGRAASEVTIRHGKCDPTLDGEFVPWERALKTPGVAYHGADWAADVYLRTRGFKPERFPADWSQGLKGGPIRNWQMVRAGADLCVGFVEGESKGARNCLKAAVDVGIPVLSIKGD